MAVVPEQSVALSYAEVSKGRPGEASQFKVIAANFGTKPNYLEILNAPEANAIAPALRIAPVPGGAP